MCFLKVPSPGALRRSAIFASVMLGVLLTACGGGGGSSPASATDTTISANSIVGDSIPGSNVIRVTVDGGPTDITGSAYIANRLFTDVTICPPGSTSNCQTLDHVLVDTGSYGLRVITSALDTSLQNLTRLTNNTGQPLLNCVAFLDSSFAWGSVVNADVKLGSKTASNIPIQLIADSSVAGPSGYNSTAGTTCATGTGIYKVTGSSPSDASALGAKGILGIGHLKEDCGAACVSNAYAALHGSYYVCTNISGGSCTSTAPSTAPLSKQVKNPVPLFASDNNGLVVVLPAISPAGAERATMLQGSIVFGIDTAQGNNSSAGATLLQLNASGYLTATVNAVAMPASFLDTGSNGLFFDTALSQCGGFYCPAGMSTFPISLTGTNNLTKNTSFNVKTAQFAYGYHVFPLLAGPLGKSTAFDGGLPFFFGRKVFIGIEGGSSSLGTGTYYGL